MHSPFANYSLGFFENFHREQYVHSLLTRKRFVTRTRSENICKATDATYATYATNATNESDLDRTGSSPGALTLETCARRKVYPVRFSFNFPQSCVLNLKTCIDDGDDVKARG